MTLGARPTVIFETNVPSSNGQQQKSFRQMVNWCKLIGPPSLQCDMLQEKEQWTARERKRAVFGYKNIKPQFALSIKANIFHQLKQLRQKMRLPGREIYARGGGKLSSVSKGFTQHLGQTPLFLGLGREWVGGWWRDQMGRPGPSTPCSPAHARGQDKGIGNYSPDSFILPAVLRSVSSGCNPCEADPHP